jgi:2-methylcitrate dehydratase
VRPAADLSARFPAEHACRLRIMLRDGRELRAEKSDYLGFRTRPMRWGDVTAKLELLAQGRAPAKLPAAVERLEEIEVAELCALLARVRAR